jgi:hypothetical protein
MRSLQHPPLILPVNPRRRILGHRNQNLGQSQRWRIAPGYGAPFDLANLLTPVRTKGFFSDLSASVANTPKCLNRRDSRGLLELLERPSLNLFPCSPQQVKFTSFSLTTERLSEILWRNPRLDCKLVVLERADGIRPYSGSITFSGICRRQH